MLPSSKAGWLYGSCLPPAADADMHPRLRLITVIRSICLPDQMPLLQYRCMQCWTLTLLCHAALQVTTVDKYQGQQNDYVLLSLVRTRAVGHLRDVRRLVVALSRARLGLYIFGRAQLFANCYEMAPAMQQLLARPLHFALQPDERWQVCAAARMCACMPGAARPEACMWNLRMLDGRACAARHVLH